ncbi:MAG: hypothetical protein A2857_04020 [Candidatus Levybacteria bacterium RIFCSPHIGHO2_01_FULL_36_15]|nr:MAG: hypothetical protein A2857_04020 [Candidatus Levybacteria bacterium RIFCSPHIGHO2_01_FULL_36_15]OGH39180.1 MAG: hypothetical protein A2905_03110 [Candidatus Levybacteria bacterium RIFCSPLOWO2_01_FULL_36_10]
MMENNEINTLSIKSSKHNPDFIRIIILIILPIIGFFMGIKYQQERAISDTIKSTQADSKNTTIYKKSGKCLHYGAVMKEDALEKYTVKPGDSILSIVKTKLNNPSRINEFIELNKEKYPNLTLENPFLEQGWTLVLPPIYAITSGKLSIFDAEIIKIGPNGEWNMEGDNNSFTKKPDAKTKFISKLSFTKGDCIRIIFDYGGNLGYGFGGVVMVSPQQ